MHNGLITPPLHPLTQSSALVSLTITYAHTETTWMWITEKVSAAYMASSNVSFNGKTGYAGSEFSSTFQQIVLGYFICLINNTIQR